MLRTNAPAIGHESPPQERGELDQMVEWAWALLRRQYIVILFCTLLAAAAGVIYLLTASPKYTAHASLILDGRKGHAFAQQSILTDTPTDVAWVESQVNIVTSINIAQRVIKKLHLTELPDFAGNDVDTFSRLRGFIKASPRPPRSEPELTRQAVEVFERSLEASRVGTSYVLDIGFTSSDPERAAQIANSVADIYIVDQLDARFEANQRASNWLQDRANGLRDQASAAENAVVAFKQQNGIVAADGKLMSEQQVADLNAQLLLARGQTAETRARLDRIEAILRTNSPTTSDATITDALNNPIITKLRQQYLDLVNREAAWSSRYGKNHLAVVNLRNQIYQTRDSILQELKRYAQTYKSDYEIASQRQESLEKDLASAVSQSEKTNRARVELNGLESSARNLRTLYNSFLQHYTESVQQQSFPITEARIISRATRPFEKRSPKSRLILALACLGGFGVGASLGFIREVMDRVFRTAEQVEKTLNAPCVAVIPLVNDPSRIEDTHATSLEESRSIVRDGSVCWMVSEHPLSRFSEAIRAVKLTADLNIANGHKVVGFTSALPNEGKSTVATALAQLAAQVGGKVIVVDGDLRNPSLSRRFAPNAMLGITDVLSGSHSLDDVTWTDRLGGMTFLPASSKSRLLHTSEVLASEPTRMLFDELRQRYDYTIVDLPPLAPLIDVRATPHLFDGYFLIVEWGQTKYDVVQHAINTAPRVFENLLGVILNKVNMEYIARYEMHRGKYYKNTHFVRYGYTD